MKKSKDKKDKRIKILEKARSRERKRMMKIKNLLIPAKDNLNKVAYFLEQIKDIKRKEA